MVENFPQAALVLTNGKQEQSSCSTKVLWASPFEEKTPGTVPERQGQPLFSPVTTHGDVLFRLAYSEAREQHARTHHQTLAPPKVARSQARPLTSDCSQYLFLPTSPRQNLSLDIRYTIRYLGLGSKLKCYESFPIPPELIPAATNIWIQL